MDSEKLERSIERKKEKIASIDEKLKILIQKQESLKKGIKRLQKEEKSMGILETLGLRKKHEAEAESKLFDDMPEPEKAQDTIKPLAEENSVESLAIEDAMDKTDALDEKTNAVDEEAEDEDLMINPFDPLSDPWDEPSSTSSATEQEDSLKAAEKDVPQITLLSDIGAKTEALGTISWKQFNELLMEKERLQHMVDDEKRKRETTEGKAYQSVVESLRWFGFLDIYKATYIKVAERRFLEKRFKSRSRLSIEDEVRILILWILFRDVYRIADATGHTLQTVKKYLTYHHIDEGIGNSLLDSYGDNAWRWDYENYRSLHEAEIEDILENWKPKNF